MGTVGPATDAQVSNRSGGPGRETGASSPRDTAGISGPAAAFPVWWLERKGKAVLRSRLVSSGWLAIGLLFALGTSAHASTTYVYSGNDYNFFTPPYQFFDSVALRITFATPLAPDLADADLSFAPVSFSFADGQQTITQVEQSIFAFTVSTDALGTITSWEAYAFQPSNGFDIYSCDRPSCSDALNGGTIALPIDAGRFSGAYSGSGDYAETRNDVGTWSVVATSSYEQRSGAIVDPILGILGAPYPFSGPNLQALADLSGANLSGASLIQAELGGANLSGANFATSVLTGANLAGADLTGAGVAFANLGGADLRGATLTGIGGQLAVPPSLLPVGYRIANDYIVGPGVFLGSANLAGENLSSLDLSNVDLTSANLTGADLTGALLAGADLLNADLTGALLAGIAGQLAGLPSLLPTGYQIANDYIVGPDVVLANADLSGTNLSGLALTDVDLTNANLTDAQVGGVSFTGTDLSTSTLDGVSGQLAAGPSQLPPGYVVVNGYIVGPNVDLSGADLAGATLAGLDLSGADLTGAILTTADLGGANLSAATLSLADLTGANLLGAILTNATLTNVVFDGADLTGLDLSGQDLSGTSLAGAILTNADLSSSISLGADFTGAIMAGVDLTFADLSGADLTGTDLSTATLQFVTGQLAAVPAVLPPGYLTVNGYILGPEVRVIGGDLSGANLAGVDLSGSYFESTNLTLVVFIGADLGGAIFFMSNLSSANLTNAVLIGSTFQDVDLAGADLTGTDLSGATLVDIRGQLVGAPSTLPPGFVVANDYIVGPGLDLSTADLSGTDLSGLDLSGIDLSGANLTGANLSGSTLTFANLIGANLTGADLSNTTFVNADLTDADASGADFTNALLNTVIVTNTNFTGAILIGVQAAALGGTPAALPTGYVIRQNVLLGPGVDLSNLDLTSGNLTGLDLTGASLVGTQLQNANLTASVLLGVRSPVAPFVNFPPFASAPVLPPGYQFTSGFHLVGPGVDLSNTDVSGVAIPTGLDLTGANFTNADLSGSLFDQTNLTGADLTNANLNGTGLQGVNLSGADLTGVDMSGTAIFAVTGQLAAPPATPPTGFLVANLYLLGPNVILSNVDLSGTDLTGVDLSGAALDGADLTNATLDGGTLAGTFFILATLDGASLAGADLGGAALDGASLLGASLTGADLTGATVQSTVWTGATYDETTVFPSGNAWDTPPYGLDGGITPWDAGMVPVPEPALGVMLAAGCLALAGLRRARRGPSRRPRRRGTE